MDSIEVLGYASRILGIAFYQQGGISLFQFFFRTVGTAEGNFSNVINERMVGKSGQVATAVRPHEKIILFVIPAAISFV